VQPGAVEVHLERQEPPDRELIRPGAVHAEDPLGVPGRESAGMTPGASLLRQGQHRATRWLIATGSLVIRLGPTR
jgi:hypothetical protein